MKKGVKEVNKKNRKSKEEMKDGDEKDWKLKGKQRKKEWRMKNGKNEENKTKREGGIKVKKRSK